MRQDWVFQGEILRYPFLAAIEKYIEQGCSLCAESTISVRRKILRYLAGVLEDLRERGEIKTTHPKYMDDNDIIALIKWMRSRNLDPATQCKWLQFVDGLLLVHGNSTVQTMRKMHKHVFPRPQRKPIFVKTDDEIGRMVTATEQIPGWPGVVGKFLCIVYPLTGLRVSELRRAHLDDLIITPEKITLRVRHPKGENTYGQHRIVLIHPGALPHIQEYLRQRAEYLKTHGATSECLIPFCYHNGTVEEWTHALWGQLSGEIRLRSGVNFNWRQLRPTYAHKLANQYNVDMKDIAVQLGHASTATTERYYARISEAKAQDRINSAFQSGDVRDGLKIALPTVN